MSYEKKGPLPEEKEFPRQAIDEWLYELGNLTQETLQTEFGSHLSPDRLREHGEGRIRSASETDEALHIALCKPCFRQVLDFERGHMERLLSEATRPFEISNVFLESGRESPAFELIRMRSLLVTLQPEGGILSLTITADDLSELTVLQIDDQVQGCRVPWQKRMKDRVLEAQLGKLSDFRNRELSFCMRFQKRDLNRIVRFIPTSPV